MFIPYILSIEKHVLLEISQSHTTSRYNVTGPYILSIEKSVLLEISHSTSWCNVTGPLLTTFLSAFIYFRVSNPHRKCKSLITGTLVHWFACRKFVCGLNQRMRVDFSLGKGSFSFKCFFQNLTNIFLILFYLVFLCFYVFLEERDIKV